MKTPDERFADSLRKAGADKRAAMTPAQDATTLADIADEIEQSDGLMLMLTGGPRQLGIKRSAMVIAALRATSQTPDAGRPVVSVKPMALSDDRTDYFVSISVGNREITPHVFRDERFKAEYEAASFRWLLLGEAKPDLMAYSEDGWPALSTPSASAGPQAEAVDDKTAMEVFDYAYALIISKGGTPRQGEIAGVHAAVIAAIEADISEAHPQPQQADGRGAVIEALKPLARLYNLIDHEDAEPDSTMFFQHDACTIEYGDIRTARNLIAALQQSPATDGPAK